MKFNVIIVFVLAFFANNLLKAQDFSYEKKLKCNLEKLADSLTNHLKSWDVPSKIFKVEDFGAIADGSTINTIAVQKAIDSCNKAGGGVVMFSSGDYVTGTIILKS